MVTVSFDPRETADLAAAKKKSYIAGYGRPGSADGWHFLTGKQDAIEKLTKAVGFRYVYDAKQDQYIHTSGIMILTPQGKISRYFYGITFPRPRPAAGAGGSLGRQNRLADRSGPALLLSLRSGHGQIHRQHPEFRARRRGLTVVLVVGMVWFCCSDRKGANDAPPLSSKHRPLKSPRRRAMMFAEIALFPEAASTTASQVDMLFLFLLTVCGSVTVLVALSAGLFFACAIGAARPRWATRRKRTPRNCWSGPGPSRRW